MQQIRFCVRVVWQTQSIQHLVQTKKKLLKAKRFYRLLLTIDSFPFLSSTDERAKATTVAAESDKTVVITALSPINVPAAGEALKLGQYNHKNSVPKKIVLIVFQR